MLVRAGVGRVRLIDFDQVTLSSLNRHAVATREDVGLSKASVLKRRLLEVTPFVDIDARAVMFEESAAPDLLDGPCRLYVCVCVCVFVCVSMLLRGRPPRLCAGLH